MGMYTTVLVIDDNDAFNKKRFLKWALEQEHLGNDLSKLGGGWYYLDEHEAFRDLPGFDLYPIWYKTGDLNDLMSAIHDCVDPEYHIDPGWVQVLIGGDAVEFESRPRLYFWSKTGWRNGTFLYKDRNPSPRPLRRRSPSGMCKS